MREGEEVMKKIFLVSQNVNDGYDTYDSFVIACDDEDQAKNTPPYGEQFDSDCCSTWTHPDNVEVKLIGVTDLYNENTVICASFNAG